MPRVPLVPRRLPLALVLAAGAMVAAPGLVGGELLDRLVAVVAGVPLMRSDVSAALELGLITVEPGAGAERQALDRLVDRVLMFGEVERYGPAEPDASAVAAALSAVRDRLGDRYQPTLLRVGLSEARLAAWVRDDLRLERYLAQRFDALAEPTDDEVAAYYRDHPAVFTVDGELRPLDEVQGRARERLAAERRAGLVAEWLEGLRRRAEVRLIDEVPR